MKKFIYTLLALSTMTLMSCDKEEIGGTATEAMAGQWYVSASAVDDNGNTVYEDNELFGLGEWLSLSFNTNQNISTEMWISDLQNFWDYQVKVVCDPATLTFASDDWVQNNSYDCKVRITGGKITLGGATTPSGMPADAIIYYVEFDDDPYPGAYGYAKYKIQGYRYTGFAGDD